MKKVLVLGATGRTGHLVIEELSLKSNIQVVAALRKSEDILRLPKIKKTIESVIVDTESIESLKASMEDIDVIVHAIRLRGDISSDALVELDQRIRKAIFDRQPIPMVIVGGAGSLIRKDGSRFWQDYRFSQATLPRGIAHEKLRNHLEKQTFKDSWTYLIPPPAYIPDGEKLGGYQKYCPIPEEQDFTGEAMALQSPDEKSVALSEEEFLTKTISYADFVLAIVDAIENNWKGVYLIASESKIDRLTFLD